GCSLSCSRSLCIHHPPTPATYTLSYTTLFRSARRPGRWRGRSRSCCTLLVVGADRLRGVGDLCEELRMLLLPAVVHGVGGLAEHRAVRVGDLEDLLELGVDLLALLVHQPALLLLRLVGRLLDHGPDGRVEVLPAGAGDDEGVHLVLVP